MNNYFKTNKFEMMIKNNLMSSKTVGLTFGIGLGSMLNVAVLPAAFFALTVATMYESITKGTKLNNILDYFEIKPDQESKIKQLSRFLKELDFRTSFLNKDLIRFINYNFFLVNNLEIPLNDKNLSMDVKIEFLNKFLHYLSDNDKDYDLHRDIYKPFTLNKERFKVPAFSKIMRFNNNKDKVLMNESALDTINCLINILFLKLDNIKDNYNDLDLLNAFNDKIINKDEIKLFILKHHVFDKNKDIVLNLNSTKKTFLLLNKLNYLDSMNNYLYEDKKFSMYTYIGEYIKQNMSLIKSISNNKDKNTQDLIKHIYNSTIVNCNYITKSLTKNNKYEMNDYIYSMINKNFEKDFHLFNQNGCDLKDISNLINIDQSNDIFKNLEKSVINNLDKFIINKDDIIITEDINNDKDEISLTIQEDITNNIILKNKYPEIFNKIDEYSDYFETNKSFKLSNIELYNTFVDHMSLINKVEDTMNSTTNNLLKNKLEKDFLENSNNMINNISSTIDDYEGNLLKEIKINKRLMKNL